MLKRRWLKWTLFSVAGLMVVWLLGDLGYSLFVRRKIVDWEGRMEWNGDGVVKGCEAFQVGEGTTAILMVHGINDSPRIWRKMGPALAAQGYSVHAMRLPGFAERVSEYGRYDSDDWRQAMTEKLRELSEQHERVYVVAHSLGGAVSIATLTDEPELAAGLALIAPAIAVSDERSPGLSTRAWHRMGNLLLFTRTTYSPYELDVHDVAERDDRFRCPFAPRRVIDETFKLIDLNRARAEQWELPTLMVLSPDDQVVDSTTAEEYFNNLQNEGNRLIWTKDSGHTIPVDNDWQTVTEAVVDFVETR